MALRGRERTAWQDIYAIQQTSGMSEVAEYHPDGSIGILGDGSAGSGHFLMKLTDHPHLAPANQALEQELAVGIAQRREDEFNQVSSELAQVTLNMQMHAWNLSLFARGLFQNGSREDTSAAMINQINLPYWIPDVVDFTAVTRVLDQKGPTDGKYDHTTYSDPVGVSGGANSGDVDWTSHFMTGMVPRSIAITAEEGNIIQMAVDCAGAHMGVMNVAGVFNKQWHHTRRLRVYPTPAQLGEAGEDAGTSTNVAGTLLQVWVGGTPITNTHLKENVEEFNPEPSADSVEIAVDTGEMNFRQANEDAFDGLWVQHNYYRRQTGATSPFNYRHPFELLPDLKAPLLWQNAQVKMRRINLFGAHNTELNDWIDVNLPGFTLTMNNNLVGHFYNNVVPYKYLLGRLTTEGTVTIPWGTDINSIGVARPSFGGNDPLINFLDGIGTRLRIYWGQADHLIRASGASNGYLNDGYHVCNPEREGSVVIDLSIRHTDETVEGENELGQAMTWTVVDDLAEAEGLSVTALQPDLDKTISSRIAIGYTATELTRGQDTTLLDYPESQSP